MEASAPDAAPLEWRVVPLRPAFYMACSEGEAVVCSANVAKLNRKRRAQERVLVLTDRSVYNLEPGSHAVRKALPVSQLQYVIDLQSKQGLALKFANGSSSKQSDSGFVVFSTPHKSVVLHALRQAMASAPGCVELSVGSRADLDELVRTHPGLRDSPVSAWFDERNTSLSLRDRASRLVGGQRKSSLSGHLDASAPRPRAEDGDDSPLATGVAGSACDFLHLASFAELSQPFFMAGDQTIAFSDSVLKVNKRGKLQPRALCVTDAHVYNFEPSAGGGFAYSLRKKHQLSDLEHLRVVRQPGAGAQEPCFGAPLSDACALSNGLHWAVRDALVAVSRHLDVEGIYRVPAENSALAEYRSAANSGDRQRAAELIDGAPHIAAAAVKAYFRELPEPLTTWSLYRRFALSNDVGDLTDAVLALPQPNRDVFYRLLKHLSSIAACADENRMDTKNIAIVFAPTLFKDKLETAATMAGNMKNSVRVLELLIGQFSSSFRQLEESALVPSQESPVTPVESPRQMLLKRAGWVVMEFGEQSDGRAIAVWAQQRASLVAALESSAAAVIVDIEQPSDPLFARFPAVLSEPEAGNIETETIARRAIQRPLTASDRLQRRATGKSHAELGADGLAVHMQHDDVPEDHLSLHSHRSMQPTFSSFGDTRCLHSSPIHKINKRGKFQNRVLCVTDQHVFNLTMGRLLVKKAVPITALLGIIEMGPQPGVCLCFKEGEFLTFASFLSSEVVHVVKSLTEQLGLEIFVEPCVTGTLLSLLRTNPLLAGSPLSAWFESVVADSEQLDLGFNKDGHEAWFSSKYANRVQQQRLMWGSYMKQLQKSAGDGGAVELKDVPKKLCRLGLPPEQRGEAWQIMSGSRDIMQQNAGKYAQLTGHAETATAATDQIDRETFPENSKFAWSGFPSVPPPEGIQQLRRVLVAYSIRNPAVGYCQSMNYICALLLLFMGEEESFWLLVVIIERLLPAGYYQRVLNDVAQEKLPAVTAKLEQLGIPLETVTAAWLLTLFVTTVPMETVMRIWDAFFCEGNKILLRVGVALLRVNEPALLATDDFEQAFAVLQGMQQSAYDCDKIMHAAFDKTYLKKFSMEHVTELREHHARIIADELQIETGPRVTVLQYVDTLGPLEGRTTRFMKLEAEAVCDDDDAISDASEEETAQELDAPAPQSED